MKEIICYHIEYRRLPSKTELTNERDFLRISDLEERLDKKMESLERYAERIINSIKKEANSIFNKLFDGIGLTSDFINNCEDYLKIYKEHEQISFSGLSCSRVH